MAERNDPTLAAAQDWWTTSIIDMHPGVIRFRGYAIEDLIGRTSYAQMVWLMLRGELPSKGEADLLEAALVAAVDHGPQAPSIAVARMAVTCALLALVDAAAAAGTVSGRFASIGRAVEAALAERARRTVPMNIDGATAVIFAELGFPPPLGRGLFLLSRAIGILAHAWEQSQQGGRIKGPMPPEFLYRYRGAPPRPLARD